MSKVRINSMFVQTSAGSMFHFWCSVHVCPDKHIVKHVGVSLIARRWLVGWLVGWLGTRSSYVVGSTPLTRNGKGPFVQSNSESKLGSKDPCTLLIEDRQTLKLLEKIYRGLGQRGLIHPQPHYPSLPRTSNVVEISRNKFG